ncbi:MAG: polyprenyl synthetase family protein [Lachnospiraceae bacterium]|nr:polyprenyl synthetase family protein [Lachnospiraceae bacterium]
MKTFEERLQEKTRAAEAAVRNYLPEESGFQKNLIEASNYSVLAGGKRLRPLIMQAVYEAFGGIGAGVEPFMAGLEMIHSSSLVHDDLPCMDNDEYRRGKLTTWKKYGYDMAVLAGDDLLVEAFAAASHAMELGIRPELVVKGMRVLAQKAGIFGMIGGQSVDVELTGKEVLPDQLDFINRLKTGALLEAAMMIGCILAGGSEEEVKEMEIIASRIGVAFQIRDDILDVTSTTEILGKPVNSDEKNQKNTYVFLHGIQEAEQKVEEYSGEARERLAKVLPNDTFLIQLVEWLIHREK